MIADDPSPWGASDFTAVSQSNAASSFDWGDDGNPKDFFSSMLDQVRSVEKVNHVVAVDPTPPTICQASLSRPSNLW